MTTDPGGQSGRGPLPVPGHPESHLPTVEGASEGANSVVETAAPDNGDLPRQRALHSSGSLPSGILVFAKLGALVAVSSVFFVLGFRFEPAASGPSGVPNAPAFNLAFTPPPLTLVPGSLSVYSYLTQLSGERARLTLEVYGDFGPHLQQITWSLDVMGFNGYSCPPRPGPVPTEKLSEPARATATEYVITGTSTSIPPSQAPVQPFMFVRFCWQQGSPIASRGSYLTAELPRVTLAEGTGSVTRTLELPGEALSQYSIQGGISPTAMTGTNWVWTSTLSDNLDSQSSAPIPVVAASIPGLQRDNHLAFLSGIFFGIAGGAVVTLIPESFGVLGRTRRDPD